MDDKPHVETTPEVETTAEQAADLSRLANMAAEDEGPDVPGTGPGDGPEPSQSIPTKELLVPLVGVLCMTVAPAWDIQAAEQEQLADAYAAVVDKYFPGGVKLGPEIGALMVTAAIIMPRVGQPMKEPELDTGGQEGPAAGPAKPAKPAGGRVTTAVSNDD